MIARLKATLFVPSGEGPSVQARAADVADQMKILQLAQNVTISRQGNNFHVYGDFIAVDNVNLDLVKDIYNMAGVGCITLNTR